MNRLDFPYDEKYDPAMPVVEVVLDGYAGLDSKAVMAIIDSGADGTMLPIDVLEALGALYQDTVQMRGVLGESERVDRYTVGLKLGAITLHGINSVAIPAGTESVIGRDVLNQLLLTLNGPAFTTQIEIE
ncbi:MAG TPA: retropepsin-like aspartic protease [Promineifilum sp.]|nr:retropepsin-like aspartic protease [Promineifilum sp.]HRO90383.1 retropepsin-like aspartic protease [Promineifilum sp.]HRQ13710.1 retropepsin-like aspartic protease [Promineifilum sp.]